MLAGLRLKEVSSRILYRRYHDKTLDWAKNNPNVAQACLKPPKVGVPKNEDFSEQKDKSLEDYSRWRRWPHSSPSSEINEKALSLSSHVLSAPLTMACFYSQIKKRKPQRICCVGARAEATLPHDYWNEFLLLASSIERTPVNASIDFVGPDVSTKTPNTTLSLDSESSLALSWSFSGLLHETTNSNWDAYVLYNPGLGHDNLINDWRPTLEMIIAEEKPVLLTAHSSKDAARDLLRLREYDIEVHYVDNPFASRVTYEDPFDPGHIVRPNEFVASIFCTTT
jgi:hypothetical protein